MMSRAIARAFAADAKRFVGRSTVFVLREPRPLTALLPLSARIAAPCASQTYDRVTLARHYATAQPKPRKPATRKATPVNKKGKRTTAKKKASAKKKKKTTTTKRKQAKPKTELQKKQEKVKRLKKEALLDTPRMLPPTAFTVYSSEQITKGASAVSQVRQTSANFRNLSASDREHYANIASENIRANGRTLKMFIEKHTPDEIRIANNARRQLNKIAEEPPPSGRRTRLVGRKVRLLGDERAVKRPQTPYIQFLKDRFASGDLQNVSPVDAIKTIAREWNSLSRQDAQKYRDAFQADREKYNREVRRVYASK